MPSKYDMFFHRANWGLVAAGNLIAGHAAVTLTSAIRSVSCVVPFRRCDHRPRSKGSRSKLVAAQAATAVHDPNDFLDPEKRPQVIARRAQSGAQATHRSDGKRLPDEVVQRDAVRCHAAGCVSPGPRCSPCSKFIASMASASMRVSSVILGQLGVEFLLRPRSGRRPDRDRGSRWPHQSPPSRGRPPGRYGSIQRPPGRMVTPRISSR